MTFGLQQHPEWYPGLTSRNSSADFQRFLRSLTRRNFKATCAEPCAGDDGEFVGQPRSQQHQSSFEQLSTPSLPARPVVTSLRGSRRATCSDGIRVRAPPHVLVLMADDLGYQDLSYMGSSIIDTPAIDALASDAVHLTNFFAPTWCAPSRAAFISGRVPWEVGVTAGVMHPPRAGLLLLPEALRAAGYRTALVGKNHMVADRRAHPTGHPRVGHGLDHFCGFYGGACGYWARSGWQCNGEPSQEAANRSVYTTDLISHMAVRVIESHPAAVAPLFLWVSWTAPHRPLEAHPAVLDRMPATLPPRSRVYAAMVSSLDEGVGRVHSALARRAMLNRSLIVFLSDNGGPILPETCNGGLRGGKGTGYEGGVRVPAFVRWPACLQPSLVDAPVAMQDLMPTLAHVAGIALTGFSFRVGGSGGGTSSSSSGGGSSVISGAEVDDRPDAALALGVGGTDSPRTEDGAIERLVEQASTGRSWWAALAGRCEQPGCGVGMRPAGERQRRGSGHGRDARLLTLEMSAATSAALEGNLKLVATSRRCLDIFLQTTPVQREVAATMEMAANETMGAASMAAVRAALGPSNSSERGVSRAMLALIVKQMERLKHDVIPGSDPSKLVGGGAVTRATGDWNAIGARAGSEAPSPLRDPVQYELFDLQSDPYERHNLLLLNAVELRARGHTSSLEPALRRLKAALRASSHRANAELSNHRADAGLKYWFCAQSFKSSGRDWPMVQSHHTCDGRTEREKWGEPRYGARPPP